MTMVPFPICHSEAAEATDLINIYTAHFITLTLMTLARGAAGGRPNVGSTAHYGESGSGPVIWGETSQPLSLAARPPHPHSPVTG